MNNSTRRNKNSNKHNHTKKLNRNKIFTLESKTPLEIRKISNEIAEGFIHHSLLKIDSYNPTINNDLVSLKSIPRKPLLDCNIEAAYQLTEPLKIGIPGYFYGKTCYNYNSNRAKKFLLKNLSANKHVNINKIIPPVQTQSNCWFNSFFVTFFVSDKGRKFFHYFRQLMIEGKQTTGETIPENLRHAFALLNFGIDACLTGNNFAYELNTNSVIHQLYHSIPKQYRSQYLVDVDKGSNPILYYTSIINYLNNNSISLIMLRHSKSDWKKKIIPLLNKSKHLPHIIVLEVIDDDASKFDKAISFKIDYATYKIDSAVVRDTTKRHFCSLLTCEGNQMAYDGMSFNRLVPVTWKDKLNISGFEWKFAGTNANLKWNFTKCYQLLMYYRVS